MTRTSGNEFLQALTANCALVGDLDRDVRVCATRCDRHRILAGLRQPLVGIERQTFTAGAPRGLPIT